MPLQKIVWDFFKELVQAIFFLSVTFLGLESVFSTELTRNSIIWSISSIIILSFIFPAFLYLQQNYTNFIDILTKYEEEHGGIISGLKNFFLDLKEFAFASFIRSILLLTILKSLLVFSSVKNIGVVLWHQDIILNGLKGLLGGVIILTLLYPLNKDSTMK